jgi:hypothetical protein
MQNQTQKFREATFVWVILMFYVHLFIFHSKINFTFFEWNFLVEQVLRPRLLAQPVRMNIPKLALFFLNLNSRSCPPVDMMRFFVFAVSKLCLLLFDLLVQLLITVFNVTLFCNSLFSLVLLFLSVFCISTFSLISLFPQVNLTLCTVTWPGYFSPTVYDLIIGRWSRISQLSQFWQLVMCVFCEWAEKESFLPFSVKICGCIFWAVWNLNFWRSEFALMRCPSYLLGELFFHCPLFTVLCSLSCSLSHSSDIFA